MHGLFTALWLGCLWLSGQVLAELRANLGLDFIVPVANYKKGPRNVPHTQPALEHASYQWYMRAQPGAIDLEHYANYALEVLLEEAYQDNRDAVYFYHKGLSELVCSSSDITRTMQDLLIDLRQEFYGLDLRVAEHLAGPLRAKVTQIMHQRSLDTGAAVHVLLDKELESARDVLVGAAQEHIYTPHFTNNVLRIQRKGYTLHAIYSLFKSHWSFEDYNGRDAETSIYVTIVPQAQMYLSIALHQDVSVSATEYSLEGFAGLLKNRRILQLFCIQLLIRAYDRPSAQCIVDQNMHIIREVLGQVSALIEERDQARNCPSLQDPRNVAALTP